MDELRHQVVPFAPSALYLMRHANAAPTTVAANSAMAAALKVATV
jgi:hypothetical protein